MARPTKVDRPVKKHIYIATSLMANVELLLYSEIEGKVPYGALSSYLERLIRQDLQSKGVQV